jgi:hypothetical protein
MGSNFRIQDYQDGKLIRLNSPYARARILNFFYAANFLGAAAIFIYLMVDSGTTSILAVTFAIIFSGAFLIGFYRFLNKGTETEKLFINQQKLDIIVASVFKTHKRSFLVTGISDFKFLEREQYQPHPLKGETFDYLGFQTQQQVIQDLHSKGRVSFVYQGTQVRFGKELASWEFDELEVLLFDLTGNDFRYTDKFEQENFPK